MSQRVGAAVVAAVILLSCPAAQAGAPTERLRDFFGTAARAFDPRAPEGLQERLSTIRTMVRDIVDARQAAELSLGPSWHTRTKAEQEEFVHLFGNFLERSLISAFAANIRLVDGIQVRYVGESINGAAATVWTTVTGRSGDTLSFNYHMVDRDGRWAIRDVVIDGVSVSANYRAQLTRVIRTSSYAGLVAQMRARVPAAPAAVPTTPPSEILASSTVAAPPRPEPSADGPDDAGPTVGLARPSPEPDAPPASLPAAPAAALGLDIVLVARVPPAPHAMGEPPLGAVPTEDRPAEKAATPDPARVPDPARSVIPRKPTRLLASTTRPYWVQVGAFRDLDAARRLATMLTEQGEAQPTGASPVVIPADGSRVPLARVRIGPFFDRAAAAAKLHEMEGRGHRPFLAREGKQ